MRMLEWDTLENRAEGARTVAPDDTEKHPVVERIPKHLFAQPELAAQGQLLERILNTRSG
jgi:hypothetical protein